MATTITDYVRKDGTLVRDFHRTVLDEIDKLKEYCKEEKKMVILQTIDIGQVEVNIDHVCYINKKPTNNAIYRVFFSNGNCIDLNAIEHEKLIEAYQLEVVSKKRNAKSKTK